MSLASVRDFRRLVLRKGYKHEIRERCINHEQAAELIRIFIGGLKVFFVFDEVPLDKFIQIRRIIFPLSLKRIRVDQQLAYGLVYFAHGKNRERRESPLPDLVRRLLQSVGYLDKISRDRAEIFSV